jgi:acyl carrier protein
MKVSRTEIQDYILEKLKEISDDSDSSTEIGLDSLMFTELGFESLDAVILGVAIQDHFDRPMPFSELFAELGQKQRDLSIRELVDFTDKHVNTASSAARQVNVVQ